jgi:hypothetical protein
MRYVFLAVMIAVAATACSTETESKGEAQAAAPEFVAEMPLMQGDFGHLRVNGEAELDVTNDPDLGYVSVRILREQDDGVTGMLLMSFRNMDIEALDDATDPGQVNAIVCSGETRNAWSYDRPVDTIVIESTPVVGGVQYDVETSTFDIVDESIDMVHASFQVALN